MFHDTHTNTNAEFKYLGIYLTKEVKNPQNSRHGERKLQKIPDNRKTFHVPGLADIILWEGYTSKINLELMQYLSKF